MPLEITLIVADVPPLITLAAARRLDYLLYPGLPVIIPDAVFYEATRQIDKLGAQEILDWHHAHDRSVRVEPTEVFKNELVRLAMVGGRLERDLGERAAIEVIRDQPLADNQRAILLSDDRDVARIVVIDPSRVVLLTTFDFLRQLEASRRIQSAEEVIRSANAAGRQVPTRGIWDHHDPDIQAAVRSVIERAHDGGDQQ